RCRGRRRCPTSRRIPCVEPPRNVATKASVSTRGAPMKTSRSHDATPAASATTTTASPVGKSTMVQLHHKPGVVQRAPAPGGGAGGGGGGAAAAANTPTPGAPGASTDSNTPASRAHGAKLHGLNQRLQVIAEQKKHAKKDGKDGNAGNADGAGGPVQQKADGSASPGNVHAAAERGTSGASTTLP